MIDLGTVRPGSTIRIPFSTFDKDDGSSVTMTNFAAGDLLVYKNGSTTERASTAGFTATTDFDSKTGKHVAVIDLADNTTADFWNAGAEYLVAVDAVTVDGVTTGGWIARFRIGYAGAMFDTTIATLASQTSFTLTSGPAEDDALNGLSLILHDIASAVQCARAIVLDYTGASRTVTLAAAPTFTIAAGDNVSIMDPAPLQPSVIARTLAVDANGRVDLAAVLGSAINALIGGRVDANAQVVGDKTGYAIGVGGIAATAFAAAAIDSAALAQSAGREIADEILDRDLAGGASGGARNVRQALRSLRNRSAVAGGTLTVYQEDDATPAWTAAVTTAAGDPISEVDPA